MRMRSAMVTVLLATTASFIVVSQQGQAEASTGVLSAGHSLTAKTAASGMSSGSGEYVLYVDPGQVVVEQRAPMNGPSGFRATQGVTWTKYNTSYTNTSDHTRLSLQLDGNLVLYTASGRALWQSGTSGTGSQNRLVMQNDGNLVLYNASNRALWATRTGARFLPAGRTLASGGALVIKADSHTLKLAMQTDGNAVYSCDGQVRWSTRTSSAGARLVMQKDGNLVVYNTNNRALWSSRTGGNGSYTYTELTELTQERVHVMKDGVTTPLFRVNLENVAC